MTRRNHAYHQRRSRIARTDEAAASDRAEAAGASIANDSDEDWRDVWVTINQHYRRVDVIDCVAAGEDATCSLPSFVTETGERFDPDKQAVMRVDVSAKTKSGRGTFTWKRPAP